MLFYKKALHCRVYNNTSRRIHDSTSQDLGVATPQPPGLKYQLTRFSYHHLRFNMFRYLPSGYQRGVVVSTPPTLFCITNLFHMETTLYILGIVGGPFAHI